MGVFPVSALIAGVLSYLSVVTALLTMTDLRRRLESFRGRDSDDRERFHPPIQGTPGSAPDDPRDGPGASTHLHHGRSSIRPSLNLPGVSAGFPRICRDSAPRAVDT